VRQKVTRKGKLVKQKIDCVCFATLPNCGERLRACAHQVAVAIHAMARVMTRGTVKAARDWPIRSPATLVLIENTRAEGSETRR
jgi:hypothetical protein